MFEVCEDNSKGTLLECLELAKKHYYEVESKSEEIPLNFNMSILNAMYDAGLVSTVVAKEDGKLVGYYSNIISEDFMTSKLVARELGIYVDESRRGSRVFLKMLAEVERLMAEKGVAVLYITFKVGHNESMPLRCGFDPTETTYQKILR